MGKVELFATATEQREYWVQKANSKNVYKRRKHTALEQKQKCISMTPQKKREKSMKRESWFNLGSRLREWNKKNTEYYGGDYYNEFRDINFFFKSSV